MLTIVLRSTGEMVSCGLNLVRMIPYVPRWVRYIVPYLYPKTTKITSSYWNNFGWLRVILTPAMKYNPTLAMRKIYKLNKGKKVGEECVCPSCGNRFIKTHHQQAFCKTKGGTRCKDKYWNTVTPHKRNNTTRISPANRAYYENVLCKERYYDEHPFSGLNDDSYKHY